MIGDGKIIMKKILVTILCFIETFVMSNFALAEDNNMSTYNLYVNSKHIEENPVGTKSAGASGAVVSGPERDELFVEAAKFIIEKDKASIGMLQRMFKIGFNRAARIMDQLSDAGVVGPEEGTKPRVILMSMEQFENYLEEEG